MSTLRLTFALPLPGPLRARAARAEPHSKIPPKRPRYVACPLVHPPHRLQPLASSSPPDAPHTPRLDPADNHKRVVSQETRAKISYTLLGRPKSDDMKQKVSKKLKGRVPWNKGKKLSPETRARMSESRFGRPAWNKGRCLSITHRSAISLASVSTRRSLSEDTRHRMRMARRRPGDGIVAGKGLNRSDVGHFPLVESADINSFVTLRRELRVWSDSFFDRNSRRPSLADVRRVAPLPIMRKFEKYVAMRDRIRGLASDVYGIVDPSDVPVVPAGHVSSSPRNNNAETKLHVTKHGNPRLVASGVKPVGYTDGNAIMEGAKEDMWDMYDSPLSVERKQSDYTLIGAHELNQREEHLGPSDYRKIGQYRLMETMDINRYVSLRKELQSWSAAFKEQYGRTPALSDAKSLGKAILYNRFCEYLQMRERMSGLVKEVYGTEVDDVETLKKVNAEGKVILDALRSGCSSKKMVTSTP